MNRTLAILLGAMTAATTSQAAKIAFVSFHATDAASTAAANAGMTDAADKGYTDLLKANGHTVTRFLSHDSPTDFEAGVYNSYDVVIVSRSVASGHYQQDDEAAFWNTKVTAPVIHLGGYAIRNTRLGLLTGGNIPDTAGNINLSVLNPSHPIFAGIALDGGNVMVNSFAGIATFNATAQRGISVVTDPVAGGGTVLATVATAGDPAVGGTVVAEWNAGAILANATASVLAGPRLEFLTGSREYNGAPTSEIAGIFDLTPDGSAMFLNAVTYMATIPEPSTYVLFGLGALALIFRWRRA